MSINSNNNSQITSDKGIIADGNNKIINKDSFNTTTNITNNYVNILKQEKLKKKNPMKCASIRQYLEENLGKEILFCAYFTTTIREIKDLYEDYVGLVILNIHDIENGRYIGDHLHLAIPKETMKLILKKGNKIVKFRGVPV